MATLNVKRFPEELYERLRVRATRQRRSVAQEVVRLLEVALEEPEPLSILELRGLGRELWRNVDGAAHVRAERDAWG